MKHKLLMLLMLVAALVVTLGCPKKDDTADVGAGPRPMPAAPQKTPEAPDGPDAGLPAVGEEIDLTLTMMGETEEVTVRVVELDQAALDEIGLPAYPGAVACEDVSEEGPEDAIILLTKDDIATVAEYYKSEVPGLVDAKEQMLQMMESMQEQFTEGLSEEDLADMKADLEEMRSSEWAMLGTEDESKGVMIAPSDQGYTVIAIGSKMGGRVDDLGTEPAPDVDVDTDLDIEPADEAAE